MDKILLEKLDKLISLIVQLKSRPQLSKEQERLIDYLIRDITNTRSRILITQIKDKNDELASVEIAAIDEIIEKVRSDNIGDIATEVNRIDSIIGSKGIMHVKPTTPWPR